MIFEVLSHIVALFFMGVCIGHPPPQAVEQPWNPETGWPTLHGYAYNYGFHKVAGGHVWIGYHLDTDQWLVFGTTDKPETYQDEWHAECGGYLFPSKDYYPDK